MATQRRFWTTTVIGAEDLSDVTGGTGSQFKVITASGAAIAANAIDALGIIQYPAHSGEHITVGWFGEMKYVANLDDPTFDVLNAKDATRNSMFISNPSITRRTRPASNWLTKIASAFTRSSKVTSAFNA